MGEGKGRGEEEFVLSDLDVRTVGLVRRGANNKLFYVVKSAPPSPAAGNETAGGKTQTEVDMSEDYGEILAELEKLEGVGEVTAEAWGKAIETIRGLSEDYAELQAKAGGGDETPPPDPKEEAFNQRLSEVEEKFAEQLRQEKEKREAVEQTLAAEKRARRLEHFSEVAGGYDQLAGYEEFGADLMAIADLDEGLFGRVDAMLKAANKTAEQARLFSQFSSAAPVTVDADPFAAEVERVRVERFADLSHEAGTVKAMEAVEKEKPALARAYADKVGTEV